MDEGRQLGRWAGATYLMVVITGLFSLMYVPASLSGGNAPSGRLEQLLANPSLYNAGTAAFLVEQVAFCLLPLLLYRLLRFAGPWIAVAMVTLALTSIPVALVGVADRLDAVDWLTTRGCWPASLAIKAMPWHAWRSTVGTIT